MVLDSQTLRNEAEQALEAADYSPKRLMLLHTAVVIGVNLALSLVDYLLSQSIGSTGGLEGIGTRSVLETLRSLLRMGSLLALPFWEIGLLFTALRIVRRQEVRPAQLMAGFASFGPVLRMNVLRSLLYFGVLFLAVQLGTNIYLLTPWGAPMVALMEQMLAAGTTDPAGFMTEAMAWEIMAGFAPIVAVLACLFLIPLSLRLRMMDYCLLDDPRAGAFRALGRSMQLTRKRSWKLLKIDLHFWWFYALELLTVIVGYGDQLLAIWGVQLPMSAEVASIAFLTLGLALQLGLYVWKRDLVLATYAEAYESLLPPPEINEVML